MNAARSTTWLMVASLSLCLAVPLFGLIHAAAGTHYLGFEYNTDDHMVYAAWMRQAMDGHVLMDNRFTLLPQPSLTINIYFTLLGFLAKLIGIPAAANLARLFFAALFILLMARFLSRLGLNGQRHALSLMLVLFGAGTGFLLWQMYGVTLNRPTPDLVNRLLEGQLPVDVWQPEAFVFPSMLTNGLFMLSLCLIMIVFESLIEARESWSSVAKGAIAVAVLMNVHSYDVLTVALVMVGFLAAAWAKKTVTAIWGIRAFLIAIGALIPAAWFLYVLKNDPVFQARAATETYSPNFRGVLFGYLPLLALGLYGALARARSVDDRRVRNRRIAGVGLLLLLILGMALSATQDGTGYFMHPLAWVACFMIAVAATAMWADSDPRRDLVFAWAAVGIVAIYVPELFQRKLTMGLSIPWAILAADGLIVLLLKARKTSRPLYATCALLVLCGSSALWLVRQFSYVNANLSNTTRHTVYLDADLTKILSILNERHGRTVVLALPGSATPNVDSDGHQIPDSYLTPTIPDIAPILTGLSGVYSYAGHWSETPDYTHRVGDLYQFFLVAPFGAVHHVLSAERRRQFILDNHADFAVLPSQDRGLPLVPASQLGQTVFQGPIWTLVALNPS